MRTLTADLFAGITVGFIALPLALALSIASIPQGTDTPYTAPAIGLFTAMIAGFCISFFGGTRFQIGGPTAAFIPIVLLIIEQHGYLGLMVATFMAGIILIVMGLTRMGSFIKYIPWPVTSGFTTGIAVSIIATQVPDFMGIHATTPPPREFIEKISWLCSHLHEVHTPTLLVSLVALLIIFFWPRLRIKQIPGSIVALFGITLFLLWSGLESSLGLTTLGSKFGVDAIPTHFPTFHLPTISFSLIRNLISPALAIALLGAIESLLSAVVADGLSGDRHDSNTELIAQGIANIFSPCFGGLPVTGAIARTSANISNGACSPIAGIVHSVTLMLLVLFLAPHAAAIPMAVMAAVLVAVALMMGEWHELKRLRTMPRSDALVLLITFLLTVFFDLVVAVEVGMVLAAGLFIYRISETTEVIPVTEENFSEPQLADKKKIPEGVLVYRIFGPFLFGAAEKMEDALERAGLLPKILILKLQLVPAMDATTLNVFESIVERMQAARGTVIISGMRSQPRHLLEKAHFFDIIGKENVCETFEEALARARSLLAKTETN